MALHERIRQRRQEKGMSSIELARAADISKGYMSELENGRAPRPSGAVLMKLATALGTTIADLLEQDVAIATTNIPDVLLKLQEVENLTNKEVQMLAGIEFRGARPITMDDWKFLLESIKRSLPRSSDS